MTTALEADYLVVGSGAMGMAFTDVLMTESEATVVMIDRRDRPGGHWNDAYPFVRLHQPSAFYGVNSKVLGSNAIDQQGGNVGLYELASGAEVVAYFDQVLNQQFLPSGRVQHFPLCEYQGEGRFVSRTNGADFQVKARKIVDATYMNVTVPSIRPPAYAVAGGVRCVPLNALPRQAPFPERYVVVGAGKTGMDACLWLLANQIDPERIVWIMPRDSWMLDRKRIQPAQLAGDTIGALAKQQEALVGAQSLEELFQLLERNGSLLRLDSAVAPSMYRCATVTQSELEQLRRIRNVVRLGRVEEITPDEIVLERGSIPTDAKTLHVDCSADGLERRPVEPVFGDGHLTLQTVRTCQQVFSAAFIAHVEVSYAGDERRNELCKVVPHPNSAIDWLKSTLATTLNQITWGADDKLALWLAQSRLDGFSNEDTLKMQQAMTADPAAAAEMAAAMRQVAEKLLKWIAEAEASAA